MATAPTGVDGAGVEVPTVRGYQPAPSRRWHRVPRSRSRSAPAPASAPRWRPGLGEAGRACRPGSPSASRRSPGLNETFWAHPATLATACPGSPARSGCADTSSANVDRHGVQSSPGPRRRAQPVAARDGRYFLGEVDADGAPRDAPPAPDAARRAELVPPGRQLVSQPLAVSRGGRGTYRPPVQVGVVEVEARRPGSLARDLAGQCRRVTDVAAEAGGADQGAIPAGEAPVCHLVPSWVLEVAGQERGQPFGRQRSRVMAPAADSSIWWRASRSAGRGVNRGDARQDLRSALGAHPNDVALGLHHRRARSAARSNPRPGTGPRSHRGAEARGGRDPALDCHDEGPVASGRVARVRRQRRPQHPVEHVQGSNLARSSADDGHGLRRRCSGSVNVTVPSTVARHSSWLGGKNSAFHEPGPTAHANNALVASVLESVVPRSLCISVAGG